MSMVETFQANTQTGLLLIAKNSTPAAFRAFLVGGIMANVVARLPDDYWREFCKVELCNEPGCDCYKVNQQFVEVLDTIRDDFKKVITKRKTP